MAGSDVSISGFTDASASFSEGDISDDSAFQRYLEKSLSTSVSMSVSDTSKRSRTPHSRNASRNDLHFSDPSLEEQRFQKSAKPRTSAASSLASSRWLKKGAHLDQHMEEVAINETASISLDTDTIERQQQKEFFNKLEGDKEKTINYADLLENTGMTVESPSRTAHGLSAADNLGQTADDFAGLVGNLDDTMQSEASLDVHSKDGSVMSSEATQSHESSGHSLEGSADYADDVFEDVSGSADESSTTSNGNETLSDNRHNDSDGSDDNTVTGSDEDEMEAIAVDSLRTPTRSTGAGLHTPIAHNPPRPKSRGDTHARLSSSLDLSLSRNGDEARVSLEQRPSNSHAESTLSETNLPAAAIHQSSSDTDNILELSDSAQQSSATVQRPMAATDLTAISMSELDSTYSTLGIVQDSLETSTFAALRSHQQRKANSPQTINELETHVSAAPIDPGNHPPATLPQDDDDMQSTRVEVTSRSSSPKHSSHISAVPMVAFNARAALDKATTTICKLRDDLHYQRETVHNYEIENERLIEELKFEKLQSKRAMEEANKVEERISAIRFSAREATERLEDKFRNSGAISDQRVVQLEETLAARTAEAAEAEARWVEERTELHAQCSRLRESNIELRNTLSAHELNSIEENVKEYAFKGEPLKDASNFQTNEGPGMHTDANYRQRLEAIQTQFAEMQMQYTDRITDLESQLVEARESTAHKSPKVVPVQSVQHRPYSRVKELETELMNSTAVYKARIAKLERRLNIKNEKSSPSRPKQEDGSRFNETINNPDNSETLNSLYQQLSEALDGHQQLQAENAALKDNLVQADMMNRQKIEQLTSDRDTVVDTINEMRKSSLFDQANSDATSLKNKVESLERVILHLNDQLSKAPSSEVLATYDSQLRERDRQIDTLHAQLRLAKRHHSPALLHFDQIESRVIDLEARLRRRDREIETLAIESQRNTEEEIRRCEQKWNSIVQGKQAQVEKFRLELDKILEAIRIMQRNGVQVSFPLNAAG